MVTAKANFGKLAELPLTNKELMKEVGLLLRERVVRRTVSGRDANEAAFAPYSLAYALQKGSFKVNLQLSGQMLNAIEIVDLTDKSVTLGFSG